MSDAYYRRARRLADAGADQAASDALYASVRLDRKNALAYDELGLLAARNGQQGTSLDYFDRALKLAPDLAPAYAHRAAALPQALQGRPAHATRRMRPIQAERRTRGAGEMLKLSR